MSRVALLRELGTSYGHISLLLILAKRLRQRGHEVLLLLRELRNANATLDDDIPLMQAPVWLPHLTGLHEPPLNYFEILMRYGYFNAEGWTELVSVWRSLFALHGSDVIVEDHAPTALGSGFYCPPCQITMPNMRPLLNIPQKNWNNPMRWCWPA